MAKKKEPTKGPQLSKRAERLRKLTEQVKGFQVWSQVERPPVVRTGITSFNRAMKCGGVPGGQLGIIHGPSASGKTLLVAEILRSVVSAGGMGHYFDVEKRAVDIDWYKAVCKGHLDEIGYHRPYTFEECGETFKLLQSDFREAKKSGDIPETALLCMAVDSVDRLRPKSLADEYEKDGKVVARGYPIKAAMLADWLGKFMPDLGCDEIVLFVMREAVNINAKPGQKTWRVRGGEGATYDAGWKVRVLQGGRIPWEKGDDKRYLGYQHEILLEKNSMGPQVGEPPAMFYSSAGAIDEMPLGLNRSREVRNEMIQRGKVYQKGSWFYMAEDENFKWLGKDKFHDWLLQEGEGGIPNYERLADDLDKEFTR